MNLTPFGRLSAGETRLFQGDADSGAKAMTRRGGWNRAARDPAVRNAVKNFYEELLTAADGSGQLLTHLYGHLWYKPRYYYGGTPFIDSLMPVLRVGTARLYTGNRTGASDLALAMTLHARRIGESGNRLLVVPPGALSETVRSVLVLLAGVDERRIDSGSLNLFEWDRVATAIKLCLEGTLFIRECRGSTAADLLAEIEYSCIKSRAEFIGVLGLDRYASGPRETSVLWQGIKRMVRAADVALAASAVYQCPMTHRAHLAALVRSATHLADVQFSGASDAESQEVTIRIRKGSAHGRRRVALGQYARSTRLFEPSRLEPQHEADQRLAAGKGAGGN